jgi:hypothetical protein
MATITSNTVDVTVEPALPSFGISIVAGTTAGTCSAGAASGSGVSIAPGGQATITVCTSSTESGALSGGTVTLYESINGGSTWTAIATQTWGTGASVAFGITGTNSSSSNLDLYYYASMPFNGQTITSPAVELIVTGNTSYAISLSASPTTVASGTQFTLTATVSATNTGLADMSGFVVTFYDTSNGTTLGTGTTNSSGVATYTDPGITNDTSSNYVIGFDASITV